MLHRKRNAAPPPDRWTDELWAAALNRPGEMHHLLMLDRFQMSADTKIGTAAFAVEKVFLGRLGVEAASPLRHVAVVMNVATEKASAHAYMASGGHGSVYPSEHGFQSPFQLLLCVNVLTDTAGIDELERRFLCAKANRLDFLPVWFWATESPVSDVPDKRIMSISRIMFQQQIHLKESLSQLDFMMGW